MKFTELDLHPQLNASIDKLGFTDATPIQEAIMPHVIEGKDTAGLAQTGTGKTAAFLLPLMERIIRSRQNPEQLSDEDKVKRDQRMFPDWRANQFVLVLVPTRELAEQVYEHAMKFVGESGLRAVSIYGGVSYEKQKEGLRTGVEFVIATPGRLIDLFKEHLVDLKQVRAIVFDEADRMFDMGFKEDMKFILQRVPKERQFMVFSATLNLDVMSTAYQFGANPVEVNVSRDQATAENVIDKIFHVGQEEKGPHLLSLLKLHKPRQSIVFSNFKMNVPKLTQFLNDNGLPAVGISSLLTQSQRNRVMEQFKGESDHNILVATDVAARGLDIKGVDMVVNFELPDDPENYVHRIGRTGRAGAKGIAFSLVSERDVDALARIEQYLKHKVESGFIEDADMVKDFKAMSSDRGPRREFGRDGDRGAGRESGRGSGRSSGRSPGRDSGRDSNRDFGRGGERGPRSEGRREHGGRSGRENERGPRRNEGDRSGANRDRERHRNERGGEREAGRGPEARGMNGDRKQGGQKQHGHQSNGPKQHGQRHHDQRRNTSKPKTQTAPTARQQTTGGIGKKVSGFFKRLFGG